MRTVARVKPWALGGSKACCRPLHGLGHRKSISEIIFLRLPKRLRITRAELASHSIREEDDRPCHLEIFACFLRRTGGFHPKTTSALHGASVSFAIKKSARAETLAGRARAVGVTKYSPPSGKRQSVRSGSSCFSRKSIGSRQIRAAR
jgi:hypothetical protein